MIERSDGSPGVRTKTDQPARRKKQGFRTAMGDSAHAREAWTTAYLLLHQIIAQCTAFAASMIATGVDYDIIRLVLSKDIVSFTKTYL